MKNKKYNYKQYLIIKIVRIVNTSMTNCRTNNQVKENNLVKIVKIYKIKSKV